MIAQDDLYIAGLCLQPPNCPVSTRPRPASWWTVAETGTRFKEAARLARQRIAADPRGLKLPDRDRH